MQVDETGGQTDSNSFSKWDWCVGEAPPPPGGRKTSSSVLSVADSDWTHGAQTVTWLKPPLVATGAVRFHANQVTSGAFTFKVQSGNFFRSLKSSVWFLEVRSTNHLHLRITARFFRLRLG